MEDWVVSSRTLIVHPVRMLVIFEDWTPITVHFVGKVSTTIDKTRRSRRARDSP